MMAVLKRDDANINTVIALIGFLSMFAGFVATWTIVQYKQTQTSDWQTSHELLHKQLDQDRAASRAAFSLRLDSLQAAITKQDQLEYRLAQLEKAHDSTDERINRMVESYGNQFSEIRNQLGTITLQLALANDALKRVENIKEGSTQAKQP